MDSTEPSAAEDRPGYMDDTYDEIVTRDNEDAEYRMVVAARDRLLTFLRNENYEVPEEDGTLFRAWPAEDVDRILEEIGGSDAA